MTRSAPVGATRAFLELGPFARASRRVTLRAGAGGRKGAVTLGTIRLRPAGTP